jgi:hypothetical protein
MAGLDITSTPRAAASAGPSPLQGSPIKGKPVRKHRLLGCSAGVARREGCCLFLAVSAACCGAPAGPPRLVHLLLVVGLYSTGFCVWVVSSSTAWPCPPYNLKAWRRESKMHVCPGRFRRLAGQRACQPHPRQTPARARGPRCRHAKRRQQQRCPRCWEPSPVGRASRRWVWRELQGQGEALQGLAA